METMLDSRYLPPNEMRSTRSCFLRDLRADNPVAWRELVYLYSPIVRFWILRGGVTDSADTADILQEVFLAVSKHISRFHRAEGRAKFRAWLKTVTASKVADHFRTRQKTANAIGGSVANEMLNEWSETDDIYESLTPSEDTTLVHRAMSMIEGEFKEPTWQSFHRTAVDGISATEVAEELGMNAAAVRKNKSRVLRRLREVLEDAGLSECL